MNAKYFLSEYLTSAHILSQLPADLGAEVAFIGRSNVGKSTAINAITNQKSLARTSKTPGRTQQLVVFRVDDERRLIDLPGYGYAKVPRKLREHWKKVIDQYLQKRQSLAGLVLLIDIRHPPKPFDEQMLAWTTSAQLPCHVLLTKSDKLKKGRSSSALASMKKQLVAHPLASVQLFSGSSRHGVEQVHQKLDEWLTLPIEMATGERQLDET